VSDLVAVLTPPGRSALATLTARGPGVWGIVRRHFRSPKGGMLPEKPVAGRFWLGRLGADLADEVVLAVIEVDPVRIEVHGHGGEEIVRCLVEVFTSAGAREVEAGEDLPPARPFSRDPEGSASPALPSGSRLNDFLSRLLPYSTTTRTASIVLDQIAGAWERDVSAARRALESGDIPAARSMIEALASRWRIGRHVVDPFRVIIAGAPNVGKSSLANAIAGYQRSIVSPTPGTTRDLVSTNLAIDGWPIALTDTAGLRLAGEDLESRGIEQARGALAEADVVLWIIDGSSPPVWPESPLPKMHIVLNKIDLPSAWDSEVPMHEISVSAATGKGIAELLAALGGWLVPEVPSGGAGVPLTVGQVEELARMLDAPPTAASADDAPARGRGR
jgi:tRNA modification GTPase